VVVLSGAVAVGLMALFGKWKEVLLADYRPTVQI
jgi:putative membrane protein